jgi:hypothetical protein
MPALHQALETQYLMMIQLIVYESKNGNMVDGGGSPAIHIPARQPYDDEFTLPALLFLKTQGADMMLMNKAGELPRDMAVLSQWPDIIIEVSWGEATIASASGSDPAVQGHLRNRPD